MARPPRSRAAHGAAVLLRALELKDVVAAEFRRKVGGHKRVVGVIVRAPITLPKLMISTPCSAASDRMSPKKPAGPLSRGRAQARAVGIGSPAPAPPIRQRLGQGRRRECDPPRGSPPASPPRPSPSARPIGRKRKAVQHHRRRHQRKGQRRQKPRASSMPSAPPAARRTARPPPPEPRRAAR